MGSSARDESVGFMSKAAAAEAVERRLKAAAQSAKEAAEVFMALKQVSMHITEMSAEAHAAAIDAAEMLLKDACQLLVDTNSEYDEALLEVDS